ncbi:hypothetical protein [Desulfosporosinus sp. OT]|uniref:hypothetical protein n=1 Tax=Desulfosporosinus sp. OT TaxID=913865 RepID=UPI000223A9E0|nr:hypothetical protein [Desulfosporosinus sp. OT]EGW41888.1 hypothetical protein DOT_0187 [Desulfosporosinus sp. OT]
MENIFARSLSAVWQMLYRGVNNEVTAAAIRFCSYKLKPTIQNLPWVSSKAFVAC